jgi:nitrogen fixation protein NifU and related proteins
MYSAEVLEHFQNPCNVGDLAEAGVAVELQNPACGDILRLSAKMAHGRVAAVRFRAKGCVPAIACGSRITEMMQDRSLDELRTLTREELVESLGGLPAASIHASHLAMDALNALLKKLG